MTHSRSTATNPHTLVVRPVIAAALVMMIGRPALALEPETKARVAVLPITAEDSLDAARKGELEQALIEGIRASGLEAIDPAAVREATGLSACDNAKCSSFIAASTSAGFVVRAQVGFRDKSYVMHVVALDRDGEELATSNETCELCGVAEAVDMLHDEAAALGKKLDALAHAMPVLSFTSTPSGADVLVDGTLLGKTPLTQELSPGEHEIVVTARGYRSIERTVVAVRGVDESVKFDLLAEGPDLDKLERRRRGLRIAGYVTTGVGVVATAAGATFLGIDGEPYKAQCTGDDVDAEGDCRQRYNTVVHGAALTASGVALIGVGVGLIIAGVRAGRGAQTRTDTAAQHRAARHRGLTLRAHGLGLAGTF